MRKRGVLGKVIKPLKVFSFRGGKAVGMPTKRKKPKGGCVGCNK